MSIQPECRQAAISRGIKLHARQYCTDWAPRVILTHGQAKLVGFLPAVFSRNTRYNVEAALEQPCCRRPMMQPRLVQTWRDERLAPGGMAILVGTTRDPDSGAITYGGLKRHSNWRPLSFSRVSSGDAPVECATMNGNCVLVPHRVAQVLGNLDSAFVHAMGDIDYGLRAGREGIKIWVVPGFVGSCRAHQPTESPGDQPKRRPFLARWNETLGPKHLPPRAWLALVRRHGGVFWPFHWASPYIKVFLR